LDTKANCVGALTVLTFPARLPLVEMQVSNVKRMKAQSKI